MNRRNFLKSLSVVCGVAVVAPTALLKAKGKEQNIPCWAAYHKNYNLSERERKELIEKMEKAFWDTKFKPPLMSKNTKGHIVQFGTGKRSKLIYVYETVQTTK